LETIVMTDLTAELHRQARTQFALLGVQGRRNRVRAQIDAQFPDMADAERAEMAEAAYRMEMKAQRMAALRRQRRRARRTTP
jgi:hypothetical protein